MRLQRCAVIVHAIQHDGRNRKHHARRREFPFGENVVIRHLCMRPFPSWKDGHRQSRRPLRPPSERINAVLAHAAVCFKQAAMRSVRSSGRAPMNSGNGSPLWSVRPEKCRRDEGRMHESRVFYKDALKANDFIERKGVLARLQDRPAPSLQAFRAGARPRSRSWPAVRQEHEARGACNQMRTSAATVSRALAERSSSTNSVRALVRRMTGQNGRCPEVVAHTVPFESRGLPVKYPSGSRRSMAAGWERRPHQ